MGLSTVGRSEAGFDDWIQSTSSRCPNHIYPSTLQPPVQLDHPNIITFYTSWYNKETRRIVFITELMNNNNNGSLMEFVKPIPVLRWRIVKRWLRQMLEGLAFLHGQQPPIIHRNINCDNIFIIANTGELKIGDLGLSTAAQRPEGYVRDDGYGGCFCARSVADPYLLGTVSRISPYPRHYAIDPTGAWARRHSWPRSSSRRTTTSGWTSTPLGWPSSR